MHDTRTFEVEAQERVFDGFFKIDRLRLRSEGIEGSYEREVFQRGQSACVLVHDPATDMCLLIEELRPGAVAAGLSPEECWCLGPIAGSVEEGEDPLETVLREAVEEAGIEIRGRARFGPRKTLPSPGGSSEVIWHYIVQADLSGVTDGTVHGVDGEAEATTVRLVPRAEAVRMLDAGVCNGLMATLVMWLESLIASGKADGGETA